MNTLTYRPLWLAIGWSLVLTISMLSLAPTSRLPDVEYNDKVGHLLAYFSLMAWFGQIYSRRLWTALGLLALGGALEILQGLSGYRDMSGFDLLANSTGLICGWLFSLAFPDLLAKLEASWR